MKSTFFLMALIGLLFGVTACSEDQGPTSATQESTAVVDYSQFDLGDDVTPALLEKALSLLPVEVVDRAVAGAACNIAGTVSVALQFEKGTICAYNINIFSGTHEVTFYIANGKVFQHGEKRRYDISDDCQWFELQLLYCQNGGGSCSGLLQEFLACSGKK